MTHWPNVPFSEAIRDVSGGNMKIPQRNYSRSGALPIIDQGRELIGGFTDAAEAAHSAEPPVIVFGDHTRALKYVDFRFAIGADGVKVQPGWDPKFVYHYLLWLNVPSAGYSRHFKFIKEHKVPKPPIEEQRRIAAILDQADVLCAKRQEALDRLDVLSQTIFLDMFGDGSSDGTRVLADVVAQLQGGRSIVADDRDAVTLRRVLKISAVTTYAFRQDESKPVPDSYTPDRAHFVQRGDLLISRANTTELVGALAYVWEEPGELLLPDKLWRFKWREPDLVDPLYVWALFQTPQVRRELSSRSSGTGGSMKNISKAKILQMPVLWPEVSRQRSFGNRLREVREVASEQDRSKKMLNSLFDALQARAFLGAV